MRIIINTATILSAITALFFIAVTVQRLAWDYNENGVHFDEESVTTYDFGAIIVYSGLAVVFIMVTTMLFIAKKNILKDESLREG